MPQTEAKTGFDDYERKVAVHDLTALSVNSDDLEQIILGNLTAVPIVVYEGGHLSLMIQLVSTGANNTRE